MTSSTDVNPYWLPHFRTEDFQASNTDEIGLLECLVGASIHGGEKNMELLLSLNILDLASFFEGNSPQSMCVEGDYTPARAYVLEKL